MEGPRACKKEEFEEVINLINQVFRISKGFKPTMEEEFPLLLNEENLKNIRVIVEDGKVVSTVGFYKTTILIEGIPINAASVGSVCTDEKYRGKGYASMLLDDAEKIMREEDIDIMLVSGTRSLYLRKGCCKAGWCIKFEIPPEERIDDSVELVEYSDEYLNEMTRIYNAEATRYYRSYYEFKNLLKGATTPWGNFTYKIYLLKKSGIFEGYVILRIVHDDEKRGEVVEFSGDRRIIYEGLKQMRVLLSLEQISVICPFNDWMVNIIREKKLTYEEINLLGTIKILNFARFMDKLRPYFRQYVDRDIVKSINFREDNGIYIFEIGEEMIKINDISKLTKLVFGDKGFNTDGISSGPTIDSFIHSVFPLPFVWPGNLNYQ